MKVKPRVTDGITENLERSPLDENSLKAMLEHLGGQAWGLVYMTDEVFFCYEKACCFSNKIKSAGQAAERLMEYRFFSDAGEYHLWQYGGTYRCGFLSSEECENTYSSEVVLWGNDYERDKDGHYMKYSDGTYRLFEVDRGCRFGFPLALSKDILPLKLKIVSYYDFTDDGLLNFVDMRIANIVNAKGDRL